MQKNHVNQSLVTLLPHQLFLGSKFLDNILSLSLSNSGSLFFTISCKYFISFSAEYKGSVFGNWALTFLR